MSAFHTFFSSGKLNPRPRSVFHAYVQMQVVREARPNIQPSLHDLVDAHSSAKKPFSPPFSIFLLPSSLFLSLSLPNLLARARSLLRARVFAMYQPPTPIGHSVSGCPASCERKTLLLQAKRVFPLGRAERSSNTWDQGKMNSTKSGQPVGRLDANWTNRASTLHERPHSTPADFTCSTTAYASRHDNENNPAVGQPQLSRRWSLLMGLLLIFGIGLGSGWLLRGHAETEAQVVPHPISRGAALRQRVNAPGNGAKSLDRDIRAADNAAMLHPLRAALDAGTGARGVNVHLRLGAAAAESPVAVNQVKLPELPPANTGTLKGVCTVHVTGVPKSGTTWLERIIGSIAETACKNDASAAGSTVPCKFESISPRTPHGRGFVAGPFSAASKCAYVDFSIASKHTMANHLMSRVALAKPNKTPNFSSTGQTILELCTDASPSLPAYSDTCVSTLEATFHTTIKVPPPVASKNQRDSQDLLIGILRDPRAVALSSCRFKFPKKALEDCPSATSDFRADTASLAMLWTRTGASASHERSTRSATRRSALAVFFEGMKLNPMPAYEKIADVMGLADLLGEAGLQSVADESSVAAMAAAEKDHDKNAHWMDRSYHVNYGMGAKVREGSVDGFMEAFGDEILGKMNRTMIELLPPNLKQMYGLQL